MRTVARTPTRRGSWSTSASELADPASRSAGHGERHGHELVRGRRRRHLEVGHQQVVHVTVLGGDPQRDPAHVLRHVGLVRPARVGQAHGRVQRDPRLEATLPQLLTAAPGRRAGRRRAPPARPWRGTPGPRRPRRCGGGCASWTRTSVAGQLVEELPLLPALPPSYRSWVIGSPRPTRRLDAGKSAGWSAGDTEVSPWAASGLLRRSDDARLDAAADAAHNFEEPAGGRRWRTPIRSFGR